MLSHPCATPQLRCSSFLQQQQELQQQRRRRAGCSAARSPVAPVARAAGQGTQLSGLGVVRLVAAAIPVRYTSTGTEVCLVTSSRGKGEGLVLPKVCAFVCGAVNSVAAFTTKTTAYSGSVASYVQPSTLVCAARDSLTRLSRASAGQRGAQRYRRECSCHTRGPGGGGRGWHGTPLTKDNTRCNRLHTRSSSDATGLRRSAT